jgi:hypothetical protein
MQVLHFILPYILWIMVIMWVLHFAPTYKCASLNCYVGIAFRAPTYSVDYDHNVGIAFPPQI